MINVLSLSAVDRWFEPLLCQTKDYKLISAVKRQGERANNNRLTRYLDNESELRGMSTIASNIKSNLASVGLVQSRHSCGNVALMAFIFGVWSSMVPNFFLRRCKLKTTVPYAMRYILKVAHLA